LNISGAAFKPGGGSWSNTSDLRLKRSVEPIKDALQQVLQLRGVSYEYANALSIGELPGMQIGMIAQDVERVFPQWVDEGEDGYKRLTFRGFEALTVEAIRELDAKAATGAELASRVLELERQNAELRALLDALAAKLAQIVP
jgi:hypothetical protein